MFYFLFEFGWQYQKFINASTDETWAKCWQARLTNIDKLTNWLITLSTQKSKTQMFFLCLILFYQVCKQFKCNVLISPDQIRPVKGNEELTDELKCYQMRSICVTFLNILKIFKFLFTSSPLTKIFKIGIDDYLWNA